MSLFLQQKKIQQIVLLYRLSENEFSVGSKNMILFFTVGSRFGSGSETRSLSENPGSENIIPNALFIFLFYFTYEAHGPKTVRIPHNPTYIHRYHKIRQGLPPPTTTWLGQNPRGRVGFGRPRGGPTYIKLPADTTCHYHPKGLFSKIWGGGGGSLRLFLGCLGGAQITGGIKP
jgi:hypothetical protein